MQSIKVEIILNQIKALDQQARTYLIEQIKRLQKDEENKSALNKLSDLRGLGRDIWTNIDIDKYVEHEREWE